MRQAAPLFCILLAAVLAGCLDGPGPLPTVDDDGTACQRWLGPEAVENITVRVDGREASPDPAGDVGAAIAYEAVRAIEEILAHHRQMIRDVRPILNESDHAILHLPEGTCVRLDNHDGRTISPPSFILVLSSQYPSAGLAGKVLPCTHHVCGEYSTERSFDELRRRAETAVRP